MEKIIWVGMDVHKDFLMIAVLPEGATAPTRVERVINEPTKLRRFFGRLSREGTVRACYEASGAGFVLQRGLASWGIACEIIAPSLIPTRPGEQRKHDKRDAIQLARLYRAGELVVIRVPTEAEERVRDLVRCRDGLVYREGEAWARAHARWLQALKQPGVLAAEDAIVFQEYQTLVEYLTDRRDALDREIATLALRPALAAPVAALRCFRGIETQAAMVLATEIGDWRRFTSPRQLMAYLGLVPREASSGGRERKGSLTKAGNSHCRHVLIQAAWAYRHVPLVSGAFKLRQEGQPPGVVMHAWKAQRRLHKVYARLSYRKRPAIAVVAVARELVGFLWAAMQEVQTLAAPLAQVA
jgi:transposase